MRSTPFKPQDVAHELATANENRGARTALMVVPDAAILPGGAPFIDVGPGSYAVAYDPEVGDELAFDLAYRAARAEASREALPVSEDGVDS